MGVGAQGDVRHPLQLPEELEGHPRRHHPDGVRDVEHLGARLPGGDADLLEVVHVGAGGVLGAVLDEDAVLLRVLDALDGLAHDLLPRRLHHRLDVEVARRYEDVDVGHVALQGPVDVLLERSGEGHNLGVEAEGCDPLHRLGLAVGGYGEPGLYLRDPQLVQLLRYQYLLVYGVRDPVHLLPVTQGRVEDPYLFRGADLRRGFVLTQVEPLIAHMPHRGCTMQTSRRLITVLSKSPCVLFSYAKILA